MATDYLDLEPASGAGGGGGEPPSLLNRIFGGVRAIGGVFQAAGGVTLAGGVQLVRRGLGLLHR